MMNFLAGGLRPILSRFLLDAAALAGLGYSTFSSPSPQGWNVLLASTVGTLATAGLTNRWTLTFPMVVLVPLLAFKHLHTKQQNIGIIVIGSICLLVAAASCMFFPAVQLRQIEGLYNVGVAELHLPVNYGSVYDPKASNTTVDGHVAVKIVYPTRERSPLWGVSYMNPKTAVDYLTISMKTAPPPPLNKLTFFLDAWKLVRMEAKQNAKPIDGEPLPIITYSHGLGGSSLMYSYQVHSLASQGYVVVSVDHTDRSAPVALKQDGSRVYLNTDILEVRRHALFHCAFACAFVCVFVSSPWIDIYHCRLKLPCCCWLLLYIPPPCFQHVAMEERGHSS